MGDSVAYSNFLFARVWVSVLAGSLALPACGALKPNEDQTGDAGESNGGAQNSGGSVNQGGSGATSGAQQGGTSGNSGPTGGVGATGASAGNGALGGTGGATGASGGAPVGGTSGISGNAGSGGIFIGTPGPPYRFPQGYRSSRCAYPANADPNVARAAYDRWKMELVTPDGAGGFQRVRRPNNEGDTTVSEGIAYGMIFAVVMDDQTLFDAFWKYSQLHVNGNGLMNWKVDPSGTVPMDGMGAATDADEDMAWALILADRKWGGSGSLGMPYLDVARAQIDRIWEHEVDHDRGDLLLAGDSWGMTVTHNPSYFAPNQYRRFGLVTNRVAEWNRVIDRNYTLLAATLTAARGNVNNGLVPAWTDESGAPMSPFMGAPMHHQYDSARIPFRIAQDWCDFGDMRAKTYLDKATSFFKGVGVPQIVDGYELNGTARPENPLPAQSALFVGAAAVGAMNGTANQAFVNEAYNLFLTKEMLPPSYYFNLSWQVFSLLMMTGNLYDWYLVE
jgi:endo-1,4-beta-D-glucanase Y